MFIQNVGAADIPRGYHFDCGENSMLIQISDPFVRKEENKFGNTPWFPEPKHKFREIHKFEFLDIEDGWEGAEQYGINDEQAKQLVDLLQHALDNKMHVVVHCFAGICRSGAVVEVGTMMGFEETEAMRMPNTRVKTKMLKVLGWSYGEERDGQIYSGD